MNPLDEDQIRDLLKTAAPVPPDVQIHYSDHLPDGEIYYLPVTDLLLVGCRPLTVLEDARREARWLVQQGLADVLAWLGETPISRRPLRGGEFVARLIRTAKLRGGPQDGAVLTLPPGGRRPLYDLVAADPVPFKVFTDRTEPTDLSFSTTHYRMLMWGYGVPALTRDNHIIYTTGIA